MSLEIILLLVASVVTDVCGQLAFKLGANGLPDIEAGFAPFCQALFRRPLILLGLAIYIVEFVVWLRILALVPLSIAFPIGSLNILGITLVSHLWLKERVDARQWAGAGLVTLGVMLIARSL